MIWVDFAKNFLGAIATKDLDFIDKSLDDEVEFKLGILKGKEKVALLDYYRRFFTYDTNIKIEIKDVAYHNKIIFLEIDQTINDHTDSKVIKININNLGKIQRIRSYRD